MKLLYILLAGIVGLGGLIGCAGTPQERAEKADAKLIHENFAIIAKAMTTGDLETIIKYRSVLQQRVQSNEDFAQDYANNQKMWQDMFRSAFLKDVGVEENVASATIVWGTGERALGEFIKEGGSWKIHWIRGPVFVVPSGSKMK